MRAPSTTLLRQIGRDRQRVAAHRGDGVAAWADGMGEIAGLAIGRRGRIGLVERRKHRVGICHRDLAALIGDGAIVPVHAEDIGRRKLDELQRDIRRSAAPRAKGTAGRISSPSTCSASKPSGVRRRLSTGSPEGGHDHHEAMTERRAPTAVPGDPAESRFRIVQPPRRLDGLFDRARRRRLARSRRSVR